MYLKNKNLNRKTFLNSAMATIALPAMESFGEISNDTSAAENFVAIGTYLGFYAKGIFPEKVGKLGILNSTLSPLDPYKEKLSVFSGFDHRAPGGHDNWCNYLCGRYPRSYSLDQMIADQIGGETRFPSVELSAGAGESKAEMSFIKEGIALPMIQRPSVFYKRMFMSKQDLKYTQHILTSGKSSLDFIYKDAKSLQKDLSHRDRAKLDEYFSSLRGLEKRMGQSINALNKPIPKTNYKMPMFDPMTPNLLLEAEDMMYDLMTLALDNGSSKVLSLFIHGLGQVLTIDGQTLSTGYHGLSHHGNDPAMVADLMTIDKAHMRCLARFLKQLQDRQDQSGRNLLDKTIVLFGTGMGDASRHDNGNLPTLVAGGGFNHGHHIHVDHKDSKSPKLGNIYVSIMKKLGIQQNQFGDAHGELGGRFC